MTSDPLGLQRVLYWRPTVIGKTLHYGVKVLWVAIASIYPRHLRFQGTQKFVSAVYPVARRCDRGTDN